MKYLIYTLCLSILFTSGCATRSSNIEAIAIGSSQYQYQSCERMEEDITVKEELLDKRSYAQDARANIDTGAVVVALVFWPALFALPVSGSIEDEIALLKGELSALKDEYNRRCEIVTATK
jgi:hypothetical protein